MNLFLCDPREEVVKLRTPRAPRSNWFRRAYLEIKKTSNIEQSGVRISSSTFDCFCSRMFWGAHGSRLVVKMPLRCSRIFSGEHKESVMVTTGSLILAQMWYYSSWIDLISFYLYLRLQAFLDKFVYITKKKSNLKVCRRKCHYLKSKVKFSWNNSLIKRKKITK